MNQEPLSENLEVRAFKQEPARRHPKSDRAVSQGQSSKSLDEARAFKQEPSRDSLEARASESSRSRRRLHALHHNPTCPYVRTKRTVHRLLTHPLQHITPPPPPIVPLQTPPPGRCVLCLTRNRFFYASTYPTNSEIQSLEGSSVHTTQPSRFSNGLALPSEAVVNTSVKDLRVPAVFIARR